MADIHSKSRGGGGPEPPAIVENAVAEEREEPSDDGLVVWSQVLGVHITMFNTFGYEMAWLEAQNYYTKTLGQPLPKILVVVYLQAVGLLIGMFYYRWPNAGDFRHLYAMGTLLLILGISTASSSTTYWQLFFSQGVCLGIANTLLCGYASGMLSTYLYNDKTLALGLALAGAPTGVIVFSLVIRRMLARVGFAWAMGVVGFISAGTLLCANWTLRTEPVPGKDKSMVQFWNGR
ncbi:hypothetical protein HOY82DRAFT_554159 [Tuber indicum]|nr:hypothetical protein HOY82DRAFT_554159 [Tuber indicum]